MNVDVGDSGEPVVGCGIERVEVRQLKAGKKVLFDIADPVFHAALFIPLADTVRGDGEAVMIGEVKVPGIEQGSFSESTFEHRRLEICVFLLWRMFYGSFNLQFM
jgi:hypothetical protein